MTKTSKYLLSATLLASFLSQAHAMKGMCHMRHEKDDKPKSKLASLRTPQGVNQGTKKPAAANSGAQSAAQVQARAAYEAAKRNNVPAVAYSMSDYEDDVAFINTKLQECDYNEKLAQTNHMAKLVCGQRATLVDLLDLTARLKNERDAKRKNEMYDQYVDGYMEFHRQREEFERLIQQSASLGNKQEKAKEATVKTSATSDLHRQHVAYTSHQPKPDNGGDGKPRPKPNVGQYTAASASASIPDADAAKPASKPQSFFTEAEKLEKQRAQIGYEFEIIQDYIRKKYQLRMNELKESNPNSLDEIESMMKKMAAELTNAEAEYKAALAKLDAKK